MASTSFALERAFRPKQIYEQVAERMRGEIRSGQFAPEARLPSERDLAARFGVGRPAVREALGALQNEGLVVTRRNSGTYVCADALQRLAAAPAAGEMPGDADFSPTSALDVRLILEPAIYLNGCHRSDSFNGLCGDWESHPSPHTMRVLSSPE